MEHLIRLSRWLCVIPIIVFTVDAFKNKRIWHGILNLIIPIWAIYYGWAKYTGQKKIFLNILLIVGIVSLIVFDLVGIK